MKPVLLIVLFTLCYAGFAVAGHSCNPYYGERVIVSGPCCQGTTVIHYSNPCYPPCGSYYAPHSHVYEERHYVYPYPTSGYSFQFGYTSGRGHGRGHGKHHRGHGDGYSFSIGGFSIGR